MTVLYPKPFKNEVCYKGTVLYQFSCLAFLLDICIKKIRYFAGLCMPQHSELCNYIMHIIFMSQYVYFSI